MARAIVVGETAMNRFCSNKLRTAKFETTWQLLVFGLASCIFSSVASVYFFAVGMLQMFTPWRHVCFAPPGTEVGGAPGLQPLFADHLLWWWVNQQSNWQVFNNRSLCGQQGV